MNEGLTAKQVKDKTIFLQLITKSLDTEDRGIFKSRAYARTYTLQMQ